MKLFNMISIACSFALVPQNTEAHVGIIARMQNNKKSIAVIAGCATVSLIWNHRRKLRNARRELIETQQQCRREFVDSLFDIEGHFTFTYDLPKNEFFKKHENLRKQKSWLLGLVRRNKDIQLHLFNRSNLVPAPADFLEKQYGDNEITEICEAIVRILKNLPESPESTKSQLFFEKIIKEANRRLQLLTAAQGGHFRQK